MKNYCYAAFAAICLTACGGQVEERLVFTNSNVSPGTFTTSRAATVGVQAFGSSASSTAAVSVTIDNDTNAKVMVNGNDITLFEDADGGYSTLGIDDTVLFSLVALPDGPTTPDVMYFMMETNEGPNLRDLYFMVDGNEASRLPGLANATYLGVVKLFDQKVDSGEGTIAVDIDFASGNAVSGSIAGALPGDAASVMVIDPTSLSGTGFTSTLSSADVSISSSYIRGQLFGSSADQLAGEITVDIPGQANAGLFSAKR